MQEEYLLIPDRIMHPQKVGWLGKLYVWSVVLELLLYFGFGGGQMLLGIGLKWSRLLQFLVLLFLGLRVVIKNSTWTFNPFHFLYRRYTYFFIFALISAVFGLLSGEYSVLQEYRDLGRSGFATLLMGPRVRPVFEFFIAFYYFVYFVVFPRFFISSPEGINYFFKIFFRVFLLSFVVGVIDFLLAYYLHISWVKLQIGGTHHPGIRFHGLAGEPRDALVYLLFGLAIFVLRDIWLNKKKLTKTKISLIIGAAVMTQSLSGVLGIIFFGVLVLFFYLPKVSIRAGLSSLLVLILVGFLGTIAYPQSVRLMKYATQFAELYGLLLTGREVDSSLMVVMNNIYPVWQRWLEVLDLNFLPLILGTGFGSASAIVNKFLGVGELSNPNSALVRLVYENGIIGLYLFITAFIVPIKKVCYEKRHYYKLALMMLLVMGTYLGHRSASPFILLGIVIVVMQEKYRIEKAIA